MLDCSSRRPRARDIGVVIGEHPTGPNNAITDVAGVRVGHTTIQRPGPNPVNTGVTVVIPHPEIFTEPVFAGAHRLNGSGELTGLEWIRESGELTTPDRPDQHPQRRRRARHAGPGPGAGPRRRALLVPASRGETYDGLLNDINGHHVRPEHVGAALADATGGPVAEGNVGGGTGMICHGFKGGIGTASRVTETVAGPYTVGVLVQANHGRRERLRVNGVPVGEMVSRRAGADPRPSDAVPGGVRLDHRRDRHRRAAAATPVHPARATLRPWPSAGSAERVSSTAAT